MGPLTLPMSAHWPVIIARPGSVTTKVLPAADPLVHRRVKTGNPEISRAGGLLAPALAMPIFKGALTEWLPTLGVSWHVPQKPGIVSRPSASLSPVTPVILI